MNKEAIISGITAFIITAGGALGVVLVGDVAPTIWQVLAAVLLGLVAGAKDIRSLMKLPPLLPLILIAALALGGSGCRSLEPGGVYQGDRVLFQAESTITTSYTLVDTFLKWELENRAWLVEWPDVTKFADRLRTNYPQWYHTANALRDAYAAEPTPETEAHLTKAAALLRTALLEASAYMAQTTQPLK